MRIERGPFYSPTIRRIFTHYHGVSVGMYTHGGCFLPGNFPPGTKIGRYTSIYPTARAFNANHPMSHKSTHGFFFNPSLGYVHDDSLSRTHLTIGNDVWIGHNAIILASVASIGDGAVIAAGSVVHRNVPPYAVFVGNPGRVVRFRFSESLRAELLASRWWDNPVEELVSDIAAFRRPLETEPIG